MAGYQLHLRPVVDWDAKPLPPLPLDPGRSRGPYKSAISNDSRRSQVAVHRRGNVFPPELDVRKFQGVDSRVVEDKPRRTRPNHHSSPSMASAPDSHLQMRNEWDAVLDRLQHSRQKSDQSRSRSARGARGARGAPPPAITTVEDLSLPPKVRQIIGVESPRKAKAAQWDSKLTQAIPSAITTARPSSTTSAYSQASGLKQEMLFHMEEIVEEREKGEDEEEIHRRLESLVQSPGFAAIRCFPDGSWLESRPSLDAAISHQDELRQPAFMDHPEQPPQDRSSREMYHDLVIELAQSAPTALPPPPKPPVQLDGRQPESSSLHHRRHHSSPSNETGQLRHQDGNTSCPNPKSPHSVFDHDSSDSESDSDSKPLWSPKLAFLGRRRR